MNQKYIPWIIIAVIVITVGGFLTFNKSQQNKVATEKNKMAVEAMLHDEDEKMMSDEDKMIAEKDEMKKSGNYQRAFCHAL